MVNLTKHKSTGVSLEKIAYIKASKVVTDSRVERIKEELKASGVDNLVEHIQVDLTSSESGYGLGSSWSDTIRIIMKGYSSYVRLKNLQILANNSFTLREVLGG